MKPSELIGAELDLWVARALGYQVITESYYHHILDSGLKIGIIPVSLGKTPHILHYSPPTNWAKGGPIIMEFSIEFRILADGEIRAEFFTEDDRFSWGSGKTHLVAAMRAIVTSKFGYEELPEVEK